MLDKAVHASRRFEVLSRILAVNFPNFPAHP
jgi:hypothetical protein